MRRAGRNAIIASPGLLFSEARIENNTGDRSRIRIGANTAVRGRLLTFGHGGRIEIGEWSYVGHRTEIWSAESVSIGDRVLIAHDVSIVDTTSHSLDADQRHRHYRELLARGFPSRAEEVSGVESAPIVIEDDAWISFGVTILRGVHIGERSIIAAGSIVTRDVPADSMYRMQVTPVITPL